MFNNIKRSLKDILGDSYINAVCLGRSILTGEDRKELEEIAEKKMEFWPQSFEERQNTLADSVGETIAPSFESDVHGAATASFQAVQNNASSPLGGFGGFRLGEDGKLYFAAKSEHYHIPLGHFFPGYGLIEEAKKIGIPNATHNNTRGYITRLLEQRLIAAANGIDFNDIGALKNVLNKKEPGILNRIINLETGSLAVEAALKMMLSRFYSIDGSPSVYQNHIPVFLVMADNAGNNTANYHGTTVIGQTLRGLWPEFANKIEAADIYKIVPVRINDYEDFKAKVEKYNSGKFKVAGFCHEIIMMNYGGIRLSEDYLQSVYKLSHESDIPVLCDEIQSCAWYGDLFLFKRYGLNPDFVSIGKGFPGGNYSASKILCSASYDSLNQFGALVTNGQEELASLSYLITMEFIKANEKVVCELGQYYFGKIRGLVNLFPDLIVGVEGDSHMAAICFSDVEKVIEFCKKMNHKFCIDVSSQTYKPNCPPVALTKLPIISTRKVIDVVINRMETCLGMIK